MINKNKTLILKMRVLFFVIANNIIFLYNMCYIKKLVRLYIKRRYNMQKDEKNNNFVKAQNPYNKYKASINNAVA